jgi:ATP-dependent exoDNAse (exonuclease V) alpha subunit
VTLVTRFLNINGVRYTRTQYPLGNAFALTIHKTQSLGLDNIAIALDGSIFSAGQAYTGLSRAKEIKGGHISHLERSAFIVDQNAVKEYQRLQDVWQRNEVRLGR